MTVITGTQTTLILLLLLTVSSLLAMKFVKMYQAERETKYEPFYLPLEPIRVSKDGKSYFFKESSTDKYNMLKVDLSFFSRNLETANVYLRVPSGIKEETNKDLRPDTAFLKFFWADRDRDIILKALSENKRVTKLLEQAISKNNTVIISGNY